MLLDFFTSPVMRAPTWGTLFMCIAASLMGVIVLLKKRSLLTEALSHATYPGIVGGALLFTLLFPRGEAWLQIPFFLGAFASSYLALKGIEWFEKRRKVASDASLSFILSLFFGFGILLASGMQSVQPKTYQSLQMLLFGQSATMNDLHIAIYGALTLVVVLFITLSFRSLQATLFDRGFAASIGIKVPFFERILFWLLLFSLIVGMRCVGVVLMSGMAIAPAVAARQFSNRLKTIFYLAGLFGALSGLLGNILSIELSLALSASGEKISLPTGPMIVLMGTLIALLSLLFAPKKGLLFRLFRAMQFRLRCLEENLLKAMWKRGEATVERRNVATFYVLLKLRREGWVEKRGNLYVLTSDGKRKASRIVRLHRLWELYLSSELKFEVGKVHQNAEEMEHILTPELEERLTRLLSNPKADPHNQPIPERHADE